MKISVLKKALITLSTVCLLITCLLAVTAPVSAASYPSIYLDTAFWGVDANNYAGEVIDLKFTYFREYNNEKVCVYIYDEYGNLRASKEQNFGSSYGLMVDYTLTWDTTGYDPGDYEIVVKLQFYTMYQWYTTPTDKTYTITLKDPAEKPLEGWQNENGKWAYYENGVKLKNTWKKDSAGWCYLESNGYMATNKWIKDSKGWCYVGPNGYCVLNKWMKDSKGWCYLDAGGRMVVNRWIKDGGKWYFLDKNGYVVVNKWMKDSKGWVYVGSNGAMKTNAWVKDSVGWCYVGDNGYAVTNCWKKDSVGWCYLNANGSMTKNAWVNDGGKWYYLDGNGYMVYNKTLNINGSDYTFNSAGVWID